MTVVEVLQLLPPLVVLGVAVLLVAGETGLVVGLLFPVEITLMTVGFLAYVGDVPLLPACLLMLAAALAGDALALRSGRRYGPRVRASRLGGWVGPQRWARADRILHRLGGRSAFVARWVPFVRTLLPRLAGSAGMSYRTFAPWNAAGVVTAVGSSVVLGYLAGASYQRVAEALGRATTAVLLLGVLVVLVVLAGRWLGRLAARLPIGGRGRASAAVAAGVALALALAAALAWAVRFVVGYSGLSGVDPSGAGWSAGGRPGLVTGAAEVVATVLRGPVLVAVVTVVAVVLAVRTSMINAMSGTLLVWLAPLLPLLALLALAVVAGVAGVAGTGGVVTAGLATLAWLLTRHVRRPGAAVAWTGAAAGVVLMVAVRLWLGWDTPSGTTTAVLLGGLWSTLFLVASHASRTPHASEFPDTSPDTSPTNYAYPS